MVQGLLCRRALERMDLELSYAEPKRAVNQSLRPPGVYLMTLFRGVSNVEIAVSAMIFCVFGRLSKRHAAIDYADQNSRRG
jgi:hypothetical protein